MWPFSGNVPARQHESCARRLAELEERIGQLELTSVERNLQVLEISEKVAQRLQERVRKRVGKSEQNGDELDRIIAIRRGQHIP